MKQAFATILLLGTIQYWGWIGDDDSDRVAAIRARLEHVIRQTGPTDPRPSVLVQHHTLAGGVTFKCEISGLDGRRPYYEGLGDTPRDAAREAFAAYWRDFK